jgi:hypothetical protein
MQTYNHQISSIIKFSAALVAITVAGCGGGGDSSPPGAYNGTWQIRANKAVDQCRSSAPQTLSDTAYVTHRGSSVTLRIGNSNLSGQVIDKDGFNVRGDETLQNSCRQSSAIEFKEASDGTASVIAAVVVECNGRSCGVGYIGSAARTSSKSAEETASSGEFDASFKDLAELTSDSLLSVEGGIESTLEETLLLSEANASSGD